MSKSTPYPNLWWIPIPYGIVLCLLALAFFFKPMIASAVLVWFIGLFWLIGGIIKLVGFFSSSQKSGWVLFGAILSIIVGAWIVFPGSGSEYAIRGVFSNAVAFNSAVAFVWIFGGLLIGFSTIMTGSAFKSWPDIILGIIEVLLACFLIANVVIAGSVMPYVYGGIALVGGIMCFVGASRAHRLEKMIFS